MHSAAMNFDIKALLTLLLLKTGTSAREIQTAVNLAATARLMVAAEYTDLTQNEGLPETDTGNVTKIRPARNGEAEAAARNFEPNLDAMNSDIKALLTLLLLQNGATSREIQTTLRLAATSRGLVPDNQIAMTPEDVSAVAVSKVLETRVMTPKQALRNEHLAPISMREFAAA